ncbi:MAG: patatin-like protein [Bryobacterales bacterium]|nr:patatin-like protein [Bryobacterales bacterium]
MGRTTTPRKELRIGLVLYGGSSLAVYMNGVVTEIWNAVRASRSIEDDGALPGGGSVSVYNKLLRDLVAAGCSEEMQVVVDTVAGTSAGGINAATLAKAIVEGGDARVANQTWINEADVERLTVDPPRRIGRVERWALLAASYVFPKIRLLRQRIQSLPGIDWDWAVDQVHSMRTSTDGSETPLDGQYLTKVIAKALERMAETKGPSLISDYQRFDLFLPHTDLFGWRRRLPITSPYHPGMLYERTHACVMSFTNHDGRLADDFALTYATRASAGFPLAFSPGDYHAVAKAFAAARPYDAIPHEREFSHRHLREQELASGTNSAAHEWMLDGGILNNKPFSHVASAIERKPAICEVHRVVVYVEPSPEAAVASLRRRAPLPSEVAAGVWHLLGRQPIHEDLDRLWDRNRKARRVRQIVDASRTGLRSSEHPVSEEAEPGSSRVGQWWVVSTVGVDQQPGFSGYVALSALSAARAACSAVCRTLRYPPQSRYGFFVHALGRAWLESKGWLAPPQFEIAAQSFRIRNGQFRLLRDFDVEIRRRWLGALLAAANTEFQRGDRGGRIPVARREALDGFKGRLAAVSELVDHIQLEMGQTALSRLERLISAMDIDLALRAVSEPHRRTALAHRFDRALTDAFSRISQRVRARWDEFNTRVLTAVRQIPDSDLSRRMLRELWAFPDLDQIAFPLMESAGIAHLTEIEVMRISPRDSSLLPPQSHPLRGAALSHFAGFLDITSRENDLLVGRLHGAERLVDLIARAAAHNEEQFASLAALRAKFKRLAFEAILRDEESRPNSAAVGVRQSLREVLRQGESEIV